MKTDARVKQDGVHKVNARTTTHKQRLRKVVAYLSMDDHCGDKARHVEAQATQHRPQVRLHHQSEDTHLAYVSDHASVWPITTPPRRPDKEKELV